MVVTAAMTRFVVTAVKTSFVISAVTTRFFVTAVTTNFVITVIISTKLVGCYKQVALYIYQLFHAWVYKVYICNRLGGELGSGPKLGTLFRVLPLFVGVLARFFMVSGRS